MGGGTANSLADVPIRLNEILNQNYKKIAIIECSDILNLNINSNVNCKINYNVSFDPKRIIVECHGQCDGLSYVELIDSKYHKSPFYMHYGKYSEIGIVEMKSAYIQVEGCVSEKRIAHQIKITKLYILDKY